MSRFIFFRRSVPEKPVLDESSNQTGQVPHAMLADILPGSRVRIHAFDEHMPSNRRVHLIAYGLSPGIWIDVLQQSPVTIIRIDNTELALEKSIAKNILCHA